MPESEFSSEVQEDAPLSSVKAEMRDIYEQGGEKLDLNLRRCAGYGALLAVLVLYGSGVCVAIRFSIISPTCTIPQWHIADAILLALFTIPTILLLAVLRSSTSTATKDEQADSFHALIGTKFMNLIDKLIDKFADKAMK